MAKDEDGGDLLTKEQVEGMIGRKPDGPGVEQDGSMKVTTTNLTAAWLRRNGVPYSENASMTEYFDRFATPTKDEWLVRQMRDGLEAVEAGNVLLKLISPLRPGLLEAADGSGFQYLLMPIRLNV